MKYPEVSVVICSLRKNKSTIKKLISSIKLQTIKPIEIVLVKSVTPRTKAHNLGVYNSTGEIIVFFDDDIVLGDNFIIENMIKVMINNSKIGIVGVPIIIPLKSNWFQRGCDAQLLRINSQIVRRPVESTMASHAIMAISKKLYQKIGGEKEDLRMNDDAYLSYNISRMGYKIFIAPNSWVYHSQPKDIIVLIKKYFYQGMEQFNDYITSPELIYSTPIKEKKSLQKSNLWNQFYRNLKIIINSLFGFKYILLISRLSTGIGFMAASFGLSKPVKQFLNEEIEVIKIKK